MIEADREAPVDAVREGAPSPENLLVRRAPGGSKVVTQVQVTKVVEALGEHGERASAIEQDEPFLELRRAG